MRMGTRRCAQEQHTFEGEEIVVLLEQPQAAVGSIQNAIDQSAGRISSDSRNAADDIGPDNLCKGSRHLYFARRHLYFARVTFSLSHL